MAVVVFCIFDQLRDIKHSSASMWSEKVEFVFFNFKEEDDSGPEMNGDTSKTWLY